jgi:hypothetical protein
MNREQLEIRLENLLLMQYRYKKSAFGVIPRENSTPYDDEIESIRKVLKEL